MAEKYDPPHNQTTIIERRGSRAGMLIGLVAIALIALVAYFLITQNRHDAIRTEAVRQAASDIGAGAQKAGDAAQRAVDQNR